MRQSLPCLGESSFQVIEKGTTVVIGEQTFALEGKTIWVAKDGKARSE